MISWFLSTNVVDLKIWKLNRNWSYGVDQSFQPTEN